MHFNPENEQSRLAYHNELKRQALNLYTGELFKRGNTVLIDKLEFEELQRQVDNDRIFLRKMANILEVNPPTQTGIEFRNFMEKMRKMLITNKKTSNLYRMQQPGKYCWNQLKEERPVGGTPNTPFRKSNSFWFNPFEENKRFEANKTDATKVKKPVFNDLSAAITQKIIEGTMPMIDIFEDMDKIVEDARSISRQSRESRSVSALKKLHISDNIVDSINGTEICLKAEMKKYKIGDIRADWFPEVPVDETSELVVTKKDSKTDESRFEFGNKIVYFDEEGEMDGDFTGSKHCSQVTVGFHLKELGDLILKTLQQYFDAKNVIDSEVEERIEQIKRVVLEELNTIPELCAFRKLVNFITINDDRDVNVAWSDAQHLDSACDSFTKKMYTNGKFAIAFSIYLISG